MANERRLFKQRLHRLDSGYYTGPCWVHWSMTLENRAQGWLNKDTHSTFREYLFQAMARYRTACPIYCLMPDHWHLLIAGLNDVSNQPLAVQTLRRQWNSIHPDAKLQRQAFDHVLRENECRSDAILKLSQYILNNPVRKQLVENPTAWPYSGSVFPGYPNLDPRKYYFWENFWKAYGEQAEGQRQFNR